MPIMTAAILVVGAAAGAVLVKLLQSGRQSQELRRLQEAYNQLDQQAKLIIRTDFDLHRIQEELDRRLAFLMALQRLGRQLQVSLHPAEVYSKLDAESVTNFGFTKGLLGLCGSSESVAWHSVIGVTPEAAQQLTRCLTGSAFLKQLLTHPAPLLLKTDGVGEPLERQLLDLLGVPVAVMAGVIPQAGPAGCLLLGRDLGGSVAAQADEELVAILTNQLASAVENSALYEEPWLAKQELERKVRQRTYELAEANAQLLQLNKAKSDFVSAVSHELRTPLAAVKGYASLLGSGQFGALEKPQKDRLAKIEKHVDALTQLINNLLDIARIESGRVTMERAPIAVEEFFATVQDLVRPQLEAKRLRYTPDLDGVTTLTGDPQHLQRVFLNLLSNAIKYTPKDGEIRVQLRKDGACVLATVSDTGCGIAAEHVPKLFQEFFRVSDPANQQVQGTGLGLALVKRIVEAHHGQIAVTSEPGNGSTFSVRLPLA
ncbi:MAG: GHKL domain-containing protein [Candidatus Omnitrophica bacterium]|nr:GHKL domain-containing protein [Candidatus Omnitrophota bacterium]